MKDTTNRRAQAGECRTQSSSSPQEGQNLGGRPERIADRLAQFVPGLDRDAADKYIRDRVEFKADCLAKKFRALAEDRQDLSQDLFMTLVKAIPAFNIRRATWKTFVSRILNRRYCRIRRQMQKAEDAGIPPMVALGNLGDSLIDPAKGGGDPAATADPRLEVEAIFAKLPMDLRKVARTLMHHSLRETAKLLGTSKSGVECAVARIRSCLRDVDLQVFSDCHRTLSPCAPM